MKYRFRIHRPVNQDAIVLVLIRYDTGTDRREVLTTDGWHEFQPWDVLPINLPAMDGLELAREERTMDLLDGFEQHIRRLLEIA